MNDMPYFSYRLFQKFLMDFEGHLATRRRPDLARVPQFVHHCYIPPTSVTDSPFRAVCASGHGLLSKRTHRVMLGLYAT